MRITASADIAAPIEAVFPTATDHEGFMRRAQRRGAEVRRADRPGGVLGSVGAELSPGDA